MILVCGEALIDLTPEVLERRQPEFSDERPRFVARPGGSPANVAVALGRLGVPVAFLGRLSRDPLGHQLRRHLVESAVDLRFAGPTDAPTTLVVVTTDGAGEPTYGFYIAGTAGALITPADIPRPLPAEIDVIHLGSISLALEPTASTLEAFVADEAGRRVIVVDPNIRASLIPDRDSYRRRLRHWLATAHVVKTSAADVAWLEPGKDPLRVAAEWQEAGPALVIVTLGGDGAFAVTANGTARVPAPMVEVADTVGAGDAFTAGLLHALWIDGRLSADQVWQLTSTTLHAALQRACAVASETCSRPGADPPWSKGSTHG
jgi:fructokinase